MSKCDAKMQILNFFLKLQDVFSCFWGREAIYIWESASSYPEYLISPKVASLLLNYFRHIKKRLKDRTNMNPAPPIHTNGNIYLLNWLPIMFLGCFCCQWIRILSFRASFQCNSLTLTTMTDLLFWTFLAFAFDRVRIFHYFTIHKKMEEDK